MALNDDIAILARQPLLGLMEPDALRLLAFAADARHWRAGDVLFRQGDPADAALLIVSGSVALTAADDGRPADEIAGPDTLLSESAMFAPMSRSATAIAREPVQGMRISRSVMRRVLGESPESAQAMAQAMGARLRAFSDDIARVRERLVAIDRG